VQDGRLQRGLTPPAPLAELAHRLEDVPEGGVVETCPSAVPVMQALAERIGRFGGAAIVIDYGGWRSLGDTFQAVRGHAFADPFAEPGRADLTAHVDFAALAAAAPGLSASALTPQGDLLRALGIEARAERLARNLTGAALDSHRAALHRLTDASEMGTVFKALALVAPGAPLPPGFALAKTEVVR
jgi:SAM-dependent MidA family methyltransferase